MSPPRDSDPEVWTTRDGRRVPVAQMEDDHLRLTIDYLRRSAAAYVERRGLKVRDVDAFVARSVPQFERMRREYARRRSGGGRPARPVGPDDARRFAQLIFSDEE